MCVPAVRSVWGIGILAVFLHALVDYPFVRFGLMAWNFALIGALSAASVREGSRESLSERKKICETRISGGIAAVVLICRC